MLDRRGAKGGELTSSWPTNVGSYEHPASTDLGPAARRKAFDDALVMRVLIVVGHGVHRADTSMMSLRSARAIVVEPLVVIEASAQLLLERIRDRIQSCDHLIRQRVLDGTYVRVQPAHGP
jgi:hypothetical protein